MRAPIASLLLALPALPASAQLTSVDLLGEVSALEGAAPALFAGTVAPGDVFLMRYTFEAGTPDAGPGDPSVGLYLFVNPGNGLLVKQGCDFFTASDTTSLLMTITVTDGATDSFEVGVAPLFAPPGTDPYSTASFHLKLDDPSGTAFAGDALPSGPPDLASFATAEMRLSGGGASTGNWTLRFDLLAATPAPHAALEVGIGVVSVGGGGARPFALVPDDCALAGHTYLLLGSSSGTSPGTSLGIGLGGLVLPLNTPDPYFDFSLASPNSALLADSFGTLNATAAAVATLNVPGGLSPALAGLELDHAYVLLGPALDVVFASNAARVTLTP